MLRKALEDHHGNEMASHFTRLGFRDPHVQVVLLLQWVQSAAVRCRSALTGFGRMARPI